MGRPVVAGALFVVLYLVLTVPLALWPVGILPLSVITYGLYTLLTLGLAADVTELILALVWPVQVIPRAQGATPRHKTAVLMTVCDDWTNQYLAGLRPLSEAGYDVFVLDDSTQLATLPAVLKDHVI